MNWRRIGKISAILYLFLYLIAMVLPRKFPDNNFSSSQANLFKRIFHEFLYYQGSLETVANFLLSIPIFILFLSLLGREKAISSLVICISLSIVAEVLQRTIPGRISSMKDCILNSLGAFLAFFTYQVFYKIRTVTIYKLNS